MHRDSMWYEVRPRNFIYPWIFSIMYTHTHTILINWKLSFENMWIYKESDKQFYNSMPDFKDEKKENVFSKLDM